MNGHIICARSLVRLHTHVFFAREGLERNFFHLTSFLFISSVFNRLFLHCNPTFLHQFYDHFNT